ncbi:hypothetical protein J6590_029606 [Homalodisca vitripennis]|nr:hypothetical protein J6590_029606 [Homalodisca vitripennis]
MACLIQDHLEKNESRRRWVITITLGRALILWYTSSLRLQLYRVNLTHPHLYAQWIKDSLAQQQDRVTGAASLLQDNQVSVSSIVQKYTRSAGTTREMRKLRTPIDHRPAVNLTDTVTASAYDAASAAARRRSNRRRRHGPLATAPRDLPGGRVIWPGDARGWILA